MQKNKNRQGLALGAVFAMVASLVVMTAPAQASENSVVINPKSGLATQTTMLNGQLFDIDFRFGTGVNNAIADAETGANSKNLGLVITKPAGVTVSSKVTGGVQAANITVSALATTEYETTFLSSGSPYISLGVDSRTSVSTAVSLTVTPFIDMDADGTYSAGDAVGTAMTVTFVPWSAWGAALTLTTPISGDVGITSSFKVDSSLALNYAQLDGAVVISLSSTADVAATNSALIGAVQLSGTTVTTTTSTTAAGGYSASYSVTTAVLTSSGTPSVSGVAWYLGEVLASAKKVAVAPLGVSAVTISAVAGANAVQSGANAADVRMNSAFVLNAYPYSSSLTTSVEIASAFTVSATANIEFDADSGVILNGTTYTSQSAFVAAGFAVASGTTTVAMSTFGQTLTGTDTITLVLTSQLKTATLTITVEGTQQTVAYLPTAVAGLAGEAKTFAVTAKDQWGVASVRTDQRIAASVKLGSTTSDTVSTAVVNGAATVTVTPTPSTGTGSAVVTFTLQTLNQSTQAWENTGTADTATWNIYTYTAGTDAFTSRTVSLSSSISYGVNLSWSNVVSVVVVNSFSDIAVSAPGLMIQNSDQTSATASDALTVAANGQTANLRFTSRLAGTYTVSFTSGTATTTSTIVVDVAAQDAGSTLTFDKPSIAAGETTTITGTLLDVNGNPVMTSGSANVSVAWTGKGLPFGNSTTMETNADGELTFQVLVLSTEIGDGAIAATYKPAGLTVSTKNVSVVYAVAVGKAVASATKVNAGSFNGYVAVYALGHKGSEISWKIAGKWFKTTVTSDYQVFIRKTVDVGADVNVDIYITAPGGTAVKMLTKVVTTR
jgi:hypothetical protein